MLKEELIIKIITALCSMYSILSKSTFANLVSFVVSNLFDLLVSTKQLNKKQRNDFIKDLAESVNLTVNELINSAKVESMRYILREKEPLLFDELEKLKDNTEVTLKDCKEIINGIFKKTSSFDKQIYTPKDYNDSADILFHEWLKKLGSNEKITFNLVLTSIMNLYELIEHIEKNISVDKEPQVRIQLISKETRRPKNTFFEKSRENEIVQLFDLVNKNDKIGLVSGIGGIGKTEICKFLFHSCYIDKKIEGIKYIGWITYNNNIVETLVDQIICDKDENDMDLAYSMTLHYLQQLGNELLLFVDNVDNSMVADNKLKQLFNLNCKLVITTRIMELDSFHPIIIGPLTIKWAKKLFYSFYLNDYEEENFNKIFAMTQGHPLSIELIAKLANNLESKGMMLKDFIKQLEDTHFQLPKIDETIIFEEYNQKLIEHLNRIFSISKLSSSYKNLMYRISLFPSTIISIKALISWKVINNVEEIELLVSRGWLYIEQGGVSIHPVISDAICSNSTNKYIVYKKMFEQMASILELHSDQKVHVLYNKTLIFHYVVKRKKFKKLEYALLLNQIAAIYKRAGERSIAIELLKESINIRKKITKNDKELFSCYNNLALAYGRKDLKNNLHFCLEAEKIGRVLFNENDKDYALKFATTLNNLSLSYMNNNILDEAEKVQIESIEIKKKYFGDTCVDLGQSYNNLAIIYKRRGNYKQALEWQELSLNYTNSNDYGVFLFNMAGIEQYFNWNEKSVKHLEDAISFWSEDTIFYKNQLIQAYERYIEVLKTDESKNEEKIELAKKELKKIADSTTS